MKSCRLCFACVEKDVVCEKHSAWTEEERYARRFGAGFRDLTQQYYTYVNVH